MTPQLADPRLVWQLAINITGSGGKIPEANMRVAIGQANRYVDAKLSSSYPNWWMVNFVPELRPEQVIVAASLIAAGKIEQAMYAVNTAFGKVNPYGQKLEAEGYAIIEDIINYRLPVIGWVALTPIISEAPLRKLRWVGGLVTQGYLSMLNYGLYAWNPYVDWDSPPSLEEQLQGLGIDSYTPIPSAYWYQTLCLAMSTSYIATMAVWSAYLDTLLDDIEAIGCLSLYGATPASEETALYAFLESLASLGCSYVAQSAIGQSNAVYGPLVKAGLDLMIAGPISTSQAQDVSPAIMQESTYAYSEHIVNSTPQFVSQNPPLAPYVGIVNAFAYSSLLNELSPRSEPSSLAFYLGRQQPSFNLNVPLQSMLGVDSGSTTPESEGPYLLWAMTKIWNDQQMGSGYLQQGEFSVSFPRFILYEHVDENGTNFGLRSYVDGEWVDKPAMTMFRDLAQLMPDYNGNAAPQLRMGVSGLPNYNALALAIGDGQVAVLVNTGLTEGQTATVRFQFMRQWKIVGYQPTISTEQAFVGLGSSFCVELDYQPLLMVLTACPVS
jgi:hypothetical protein